jgi:hypothetical protein
MTTKYIVQLKGSLKPCWLASSNGTLCIESATQFRSEETAREAILKAIKDNPHKNYEEDDFFIAALNGETFPVLVTRMGAKSWQN